jgi:signal transduction histidine kinase
VFSRLRFKLALLFTAVVFVLMLLAGGVFMFIEWTESHRELDRQLQGAAHIAGDIYFPIDELEAGRLRHSDAAVRLIGPDGSLLYEADTFARLRVPRGPNGFQNVRLGADSYRIYTTQVPGGGTLQLAALERIGVGQLAGEARDFLLATLAVSVLTFLAGLFFARRSLAPAERMFRHLERFTREASHELRTPLAVVNSELDLALKTRQYEEGILAAKEQLHQGSRLVDGLLQIAALDRDTLDAHQLDLSALVSREVERHRPLAEERDLALAAIVAPSVSVRGDGALVAQLVANLVGNALKFTPGGGRVEVSLTREELRVDDSGPGIDPAARERVFEQFYQAQSSDPGDGLGLGLAIALRIAEVHGWRIRAEDSPLGGAGLVVSLRP